MKKYPFAFIPLIIFAVLAGFLWRGLTINPAKLPSAFIGKEAPGFQLTSLFDPNKTVTNVILINHVTLVHVWASWCVVCQTEHEVLLQLAQNKQLQLLGWDYKDERNNAKRYLDDSGNPYLEVVWDNNGQAALEWGIYGTPETFVLDKQGIIRYKHVGPLTEAGVQTEITILVEKLAHE